MDKFTRQKRSEIMSKVRSSNTKPEVVVRKLIFSRGYRYRICRKDLPGSPDVVLPKHKVAIFIHGCFWHGHDGCKKSALPEENIDFWSRKISENKKRDLRDISELQSDSWRVLIVWQCATNKKTLGYLADMIESFIQNSEVNQASIGRRELEAYIATII